MKHKVLNKADIITYALVFESGDEVMEGLRQFVNDHNITSGRLTALGAFNNCELGYFDYAIKDYKKIEVPQQVEVLSFLGDVAMFGHEAKVHVHVVLGKYDGDAIGGHLMQAIAHPTVEVILEETAGYLKRRMDRETWLPLIVID